MTLSIWAQKDLFFDNQCVFLISLRRSILSENESPELKVTLSIWAQKELKVTLSIWAQKVPVIINARKPNYQTLLEQLSSSSSFLLPGEDLVVLWEANST